MLSVKHYPALTIAALKDAIGSRGTANLIHHSDQGFQYCSSRYVKILDYYSISISMSDKANPYDNAKMESFFRTLKVEEVYMSDYETYEDLLASILLSLIFLQILSFYFNRPVM